MRKKRMKREVYLEKKHRDLTDLEKLEIGKRLDDGEQNVFKLAEGFRCVPTQIAALKAWRDMK